jgi:hypothetical protein
MDIGERVSPLLECEKCGLGSFRQPQDKSRARAIFEALQVSALFAGEAAGQGEAEADTGFAFRSLAGGFVEGAEGAGGIGEGIEGTQGSGGGEADGRDFIREDVALPGEVFHGRGGDWKQAICERSVCRSAGAIRAETERWRTFDACKRQRREGSVVELEGFEERNRLRVPSNQITANHERWKSILFA